MRLHHALTLHDRTGRYRIALEDILYLQANHIKVQIHFADGRRIVQRGALRDLLAELPGGQFVQTHSSFVVNIRHVSR